MGDRSCLLDVFWELNESKWVLMERYSEFEYFLYFSLVFRFELFVFRVWTVVVVFSGFYVVIRVFIVCFLLVIRVVFVDIR